MGIVIEFPVANERLEKKIQEYLDKVDYPTEELRKCVKDSITPVIIKYKKLPSYSFSIDLPTGISKVEGKKVEDKIQEEIKKYVSKVQQDMLSEICELYVELCKSELKRGDKT